MKKKLKKESIDYKKSGVDVKKAERFVKSIGGFVAPAGQGPAAFGSLFDFKKISKQYKNPVLVSSTDGVGTKLILAQSFGFHRGVGIDLVAMNVNDIICLGAKPLFFLDYIACGKLNIKVLQEVVKGIHQGLAESRCQLLGGETAEMPDMYPDNVYDLAGFCLGVVDRDKALTGRSINEGDAVIGVASSGLHSNGFSLVRRLFDKKGLARNKNALLEPTRIYTSLVTDLVSSGYKQAVKGIAHVTGGAFYNKATKIVPAGLALGVEKNSWPQPLIFKKIQKKGNLPDSDMYSVFNMGIGMIIVIDKKAAAAILKKLNKFYPSYCIGKVIKAKKRFILN